MGKIKVVIIDDHQIVTDGIESILSTAEDVVVVDTFSGLDQVFPKLTLLARHILIINIYDNDFSKLEKVKKISKNFTRIKVLVLSLTDNEKFILSTIKSGAKGYLGKDTDRNNLLEALYTVYNGYDYYSKSITNILLKSYIQIQDQEKDQQTGIEALSEREREVLRLFGTSHTNKEIAEKLFISVRTVESHKTNIMKKINLRTTVDLVKFAIKNNIIQID